MTLKARSPKIQRLAKTIGQRILKARKGQYKQEELANEAGISRSSLSYIETGKIFPPLDTLYILCHILGLKIEEVIPRQEEFYPATTKEENSKETASTADILLSSLQIELTQGVPDDHEKGHTKNC